MLGRIYKITSPSTDKIYIGSTMRTLNIRFYEHESKYATCSSKEIIKYGDSQIELLEELECVDKEELRWKEREYQERLKENCVNQYRAIRTEDEHKEAADKSYKKYYDANKEKIGEQKKAYREANKEARKIRMKAYCEANKEKIREKRKAYRERKKLEVQNSQIILPTYKNDNLGTL